MESKKQEPEGHLSRLERQCLEDSIRWFGDVASSTSISHMTIGLAGEVGEFANIVKKVERKSLDPSSAEVQYDMAMELTDAFVYLLNLAGMLRIDLDKTYQMKRAYNEKRFMEERIARNAGANGSI